MQVRGRTIPDWVLVPAHVRARPVPSRRRSLIGVLFVVGLTQLVLGLVDYGTIGAVWVGGVSCVAAGGLGLVEIRSRPTRRVAAASPASPEPGVHHDLLT